MAAACSRLLTLEWKLDKGCRDGIVDRDKFASLRGLHNFAFVIEEAAEKREGTQLIQHQKAMRSTVSAVSQTTHAARKNVDLRFRPAIGTSCNYSKLFLKASEPSRY